MTDVRPDNYCALHDSTECDLPHPQQRCAWCHGSGTISSSIDIRKSGCPCRYEPPQPYRLFKWEREAFETCLSTLAANLTIGAGLCKAWQLGRAYDDPLDRDYWRPGCQRPARPEAEEA